eukprot:5104433-Prymnesium_polylepis.1
MPGHAALGCEELGCLRFPPAFFGVAPNGGIAAALEELGGGSSAPPHASHVRACRSLHCNVQTGHDLVG